jgi:predicted metal-dependent RNase
MNAVMAKLEEYDYFEPKELFYSVTVNIYNGGSQLGSASRHFYGYQLSSNKNTL